MSLTLGTLDTGAALHGTIKPSAWSFARSVQTFFGATGAIYLQGKLHDRELSCWCWPSAYNTHEDLQDAIETINSKIGESGTLTWTSGSDVKTFTNCVFDGFEPEEDPWLDGSGINGWQVKGTLKFRQIKS
jgi:hypothetical protein